jgi:hypothetical protein
MRTIVRLLAIVSVATVFGAGCSGKTTAAAETSDATGLGGDVTPTTGDAANGDILAVQCVGPNDKHVCDTFDECASGEYCDPCSRTCKKSRTVCDPCEVDAQCAGAENGSTCIPYAAGGNFCGQACIGDAGCPKAFTCKQITGVATKQCVPKNGSCAPGSGLCKLDSDCPFQFICNPEYGACVKGCTSDLSCPQVDTTPDVCSLGHCVTPCSADSECTGFAADAKCVDFHCKIPGGCLTSVECPAEQHCPLATHKCAPGCETDSDCQDAAKSCENSACVVKGCTMNYDCAYGKVCNATSGACEDPTLPYCAPCDDQDQNVTACGGKPAMCGKTKDSAGKEFGPFCFLPCTTDATGPCPQGYGCQEVKDDKGVVQAKLCIRQCQYQPTTSTP